MQIIDFIVCDDIRTEENGKQILIGTYNDLQFRIPEEAIKKMEFPKNPFIYKLSFYLRFKTEIKDVKIDKFSVKGKMLKESIFSIDGVMNIPEKKENFITIIFTIPNFTIKEFGKLEFEINLLSKNKLIQKIIPEYYLDILNSSDE